MANYKLTNDYWETSGVYDIDQNKTQREINTETISSLASQTTTGETVTFNGSGDGMPLKGLSVNIAPLQSGSGDPSPTNVRPITGRTGANVYRSGTDFSGDLTFTQSYYINASGVETSSTYMAMCATYIPCKAGDEFVVNIEAINDNRVARIHEYNSQKQWIRQLTTSSTLPTSEKSTFSWIASSDAAYVRFSMPKYNSISVYYGEKIPFTFPDAAGTVYGGTLDVTNGVLTVQYGLKVVDENQTFTDRLSTQNRIYISMGGEMASTIGLLDPLAVCNNIPKGPTSSSSEPKQLSISIGAGNASVYFNGITNIDGVTDLASFKTWLASNNVIFTYKLATPVTYQLDPTEVNMIFGTNNIWADCGDVTVEYGAYFAMVENQLGEKIPKVAIAPIEKTSTASKAYAVNEMFFMGDKLYIATAAIASGATFTVGTNCAETTLGAQITALLNS